MSSSYHASSSIFQPTLPARGATLIPTLHTPAVKISTHAPRTGSDLTRLTRAGGTGHFNPRSPHGERPAKSSRRAASRQFQPTLPARGATRRRRDEHRDGGISTHAPRTGSDVGLAQNIKPEQLISTHAPRTGSDINPATMRGSQGISTHAPRTGSDAECPEDFAALPISTHAPRTGSDLQICSPPLDAEISTHAPRTGSDDD